MARSTISLVAQDISCMHCAKAITDGVSPMTGVDSVSVDVDSKTVTVTFDSDTTNEDAIRAKLTEIGYPAG